MNIIRPLAFVSRAKPDTRSLDEIYGALPFATRCGVEMVAVIVASPTALVVFALVTGRLT